jgi:hypothetical protein
MDTLSLVEVINKNPESTILIEKPAEIVRIDVGEYGEFDVETGSDLGELGITSQEREHRKRRKDIKLQLQEADVGTITAVYTISRINEEDNEPQEKTVTKNV